MDVRADPGGNREDRPRRSSREHADPADDDASWLTLYDELGERVFRLAHRVTGDEDLAADVTHDTFVRAQERMAQYGGAGSRSAWVFRIATNLVRERARTARKRLRILERHRPELARSTPDPAGRVEAGIVLDRALAGLPEEQRAALLLYEVDGYTHAEIGEMLGIAEGSSKARVSRAKAALREALEGRI